jgi:hypothetical protein
MIVAGQKRFEAMEIMQYLYILEINWTEIIADEEVNEELL